MDPLIAIRFVHDAAAMLLFGASAFFEVLAPRALHARAPHPARWALPLALLLLLTSVLWFAGETADIGNGWADALDAGMLLSVATDTPFGQVWLVHLALAALLVVGCFRARARLALSAALLASLAFVGHAAMQEGGLGLLHRASDLLHLLAAGFWLGALPPLLLCLALLRRGEFRPMALAALARFSGWGHVAVALVLLTGVVNVGLTLGHWPTDLASPYQRLLIVKLVLVAAMLAIALTNRYVVLPRLATGDGGATRALATGTVAEIGIGLVVVALVSAFGTYDPV